MTLSTRIHWVHGYEFDYWEVLSGGVIISNRNSENNASFIMPANDVSVRAVFRATSVYGVWTSVNDASAGSGRVWHDSNTGGMSLIAGVHINVPRGEMVRLNASANSGYVFDFWEVVEGKVTISDRNAPSASFTMPSARVHIRAHFRRDSPTVTPAPPPSPTPASTPSPTPSNVHGVWTSVNDTSAGTGTIWWDFYQQGTGLLGNRASARFGVGSAMVLSGTSVSLRAEPSIGYVFDYWEAVEGNAVINDINSPNTSFAMPSARVHIHAHFRRE